MYILRVTAKDQPGIVAAVASALSEAGCNIEDSAQFHDHKSQHFFMRVVFAPLNDGALEAFRASFHAIAEDYAIKWRVTPKDETVKTLILVSKADHCLNDLLYRWRTGALPIDIAAIASNHTVCEDLARIRDIPFHHLPITAETKPEQEASLRALIAATGAELIVMARYMQVLSNDFCNDYVGRVINIHHSFLPGFKGARPYHQAYARGVKMIGATAHFATADLDEGPIITQDVVPIDHRHGPAELQLMGQDVEARTLAKAVQLYCERRIFTHSGRTVVL